MNGKDNMLVKFLNQAKSDRRLRPAHISLFTACYCLLIAEGANNKVKITRKKLMVLAKIGSISTYHKYIAELAQFEYIIYKPSYDYYTGSSVIFPCKSEL
jgi:hypothetical protein